MKTDCLSTPPQQPTRRTHARCLLSCLLIIACTGCQHIQTAKSPIPIMPAHVHNGNPPPPKNHPDSARTPISDPNFYLLEDWF